MDQAPILSYTNDMKSRGTVPCYRSGKYMVTGVEGDLPERCVVCGTDQKCKLVEKKFDARASFELSKNVTLRVYYCEKHLNSVSSARNMLVLLALVLVGVLATALLVVRRFWLSAAVEMGIHLIAVGVFLASAVIAAPLVVMMNRGVAYRKRKDGSFYFSGLHPKVLEALPEWKN